MKVIFGGLVFHALSWCFDYSSFCLNSSAVFTFIATTSGARAQRTADTKQPDQKLLKEQALLRLHCANPHQVFSAVTGQLQWMIPEVPLWFQRSEDLKIQCFPCRSWNQHKPVGHTASSTPASQKAVPRQIQVSLGYTSKSFRTTVSYSLLNWTEAKNVHLRSTNNWQSIPTATRNLFLFFFSLNVTYHNFIVSVLYVSKMLEDRKFVTNTQ